MAFPWRFSCDCAARPSATPSRQRRAGVNEHTAETSVLRGLARLNRPNLADTPPQNCWKSYSAANLEDESVDIFEDSAGSAGRGVCSAGSAGCGADSEGSAGCGVDSAGSADCGRGAAGSAGCGGDAAGFTGCGAGSAGSVDCG